MLALLAIICPPLAVVAAGKPSRLPVNLGLTACLFVPGVLHALAVVDQARTERRNEALLQALADFPS